MTGTLVVDASFVMALLTDSTDATTTSTGHRSASTSPAHPPSGWKLSDGQRRSDSPHGESADAGPAFDRSAEFLGIVELLNTTTTAGDLDISFAPTGTGGFDDLAERAVAFDIGGTPVLVASLDDVIHSKRTAGRPKDLATLPVLEALRDELR